MVKPFQIPAAYLPIYDEIDFYEKSKKNIARETNGTNVLLLLPKIFQCFNKTAGEVICPLLAVYYYTRSFEKQNWRN